MGKADSDDARDEAQRRNGPKDPNLSKRTVAIHTGYVGSAFKGSSINRSLGEDSTVEQVLERAIFQAGLLLETNYGNFARLKWSRASRTDKGVHSLGTVMSLKMLIDDSRYYVPEPVLDQAAAAAAAAQPATVPAALTAVAPGEGSEAPCPLDTAAMDTGSAAAGGSTAADPKAAAAVGEAPVQPAQVEEGPAAASTPDCEGMSLADRINRHLPDSIRVLSVQKVNKKFDARHFCSSRTYEYYLPACLLGLGGEGSPEDASTLQRFRAALAAFVGHHAFHNYTRRKNHEAGRLGRGRKGAASAAGSAGATANPKSAASLAAAAAAPATPPPAAAAAAAAAAPASPPSARCQGAEAEGGRAGVAAATEATAMAGVEAGAGAGAGVGSGGAAEAEAEARGAEAAAGAEAGAVGAAAAGEGEEAGAGAAGSVEGNAEERPAKVPRTSFVTDTSTAQMACVGGGAGEQQQQDQQQGLQQQQQQQQREQVQQQRQQQQQQQQQQDDDDEDDEEGGEMQQGSEDEAMAEFLKQRLAGGAQGQDQGQQAETSTRQGDGSSQVPQLPPRLQPVLSFNPQVVEGDQVTKTFYRTIFTFTADDPQPLVEGGMPCLRLLVKGQSFMIHHIRHMIGAAVAVALTLIPQEVLVASLTAPARVSLPRAPPHTLLLSDCDFSEFPAQTSGGRDLLLVTGRCLRLRQQGSERKEAFRRQVLLPALQKLVELPDWAVWSQGLALTYPSPQDQIDTFLQAHREWVAVMAVKRSERDARRAAFEKAGGHGTGRGGRGGAGRGSNPDGTGVSGEGGADAPEIADANGHAGRSGWRKARGAGNNKGGRWLRGGKGGRGQWGGKGRGGGKS